MYEYVAEVWSGSDWLHLGTYATDSLARRRLRRWDRTKKGQSSAWRCQETRVRAARRPADRSTGK